jgi:protein TonB
MADLFGSLVGISKRHPRRWRSSVPVSIAAHGVVFAAIVIVPLAATGAVPTPASIMVFSVMPPAPLPALPAAPRIAAPAPASTVPLGAPPEIVTTPVPTTSDTVTAPSAVLTFGRRDGTPVFDGGGSPVTLAVPDPPPVTPVRITSLMQTPVKTVDVAPAYPPMARAAKVSGVVILEAVIGVDGRVSEVRVLRSVAWLDRAALDAVRQWRYSPTILNGVAVPVILTVTVTFTLK